MALRHIIQIRKFSTSRTLFQPLLSENYKSKKLWEQRFNCPILSGDERIIKTINSKIILGQELSNLEIDIFINIAVPSQKETAQLVESVKLIEGLRRSLYAHTVMPSTHHAFCRLFLDSERLDSLVKILDKRVNYGIFPDFYAMNLIFDKAIEKENYSMASKLSSLIMLQEEFGMNPITDRLALFSISKFIELEKNFDNWLKVDAEDDQILSAVKGNQVEHEQNSAEQKKETESSNDGDDDEDEDDAEYIRVPFLRNPYFDNHFDLTNPRIICGKSLEMLGKTFGNQDEELSLKSILYGQMLLGKWEDTLQTLNKQPNLDLGNLREQFLFYIDNLHGITGPSESQKGQLIASLKDRSVSTDSFSQLVRTKCQNLDEFERSDIRQFELDLKEWSSLRINNRKRQDDKIARDKLIAEIKAKKEELQLKEQYLYFFDNLHKSKITRINYD